MAISLVMMASAAEVEALLDRDSVPVGQGALLTLSISDSSPARPEIPAVDKLIVQPRGQSHKMQNFNGITTMSVEYSYVVGSNTAGDYEIPSIQVRVGGEVLKTQPLKLKVLDAGAAQAPAGMPPGNADEQPPEPPQDEAADRFGFLTVDLADSARDHVYVGEIAPVRIRAWLPADSQAQLRSGIQPEGKAFTLHNVSERPQQTQEMKDGKRYTVVTWFGGISATKAGKYPVSLSLDATVAVRDTSAPRPQRRRRGGPFDDPFFDNVFDQMNAPVIQKDVTLKSVDEEMEVRALPTEGRPEGFSGAVGKFKLDSYEIPSNWKTGEPQQITAQVGGSGNFTLLNAPQLAPADGWKVYPGKSDFTAGDQAAFSGSKIFHFSALPRKGGDQDAVLKFSYFDPESATYQTVEGPPKRIVVTGEDMVEVKPGVPVEPVKKIEKKTPALIGQHTRSAPVETLLPLVSHSLFVPLLVSSGGMVLLGLVIGALRVRRDDPQRLARAATERATREARDVAVRCADARDIPGFFAAARLALQHPLGAMWNQPPQAITSAEVWSRLPADSPVSRFFREADRHEYNRASGAEVLPEWRALLDEALASLNPYAR
ncbi:MAG: BatD family protein [Verrucomicrobiota bacterium]